MFRQRDLKRTLGTPPPVGKSILKADGSPRSFSAPTGPSEYKRQSKDVKGDVLEAPTRRGFGYNRSSRDEVPLLGAVCHDGESLPAGDAREAPAMLGPSRATTAPGAA